MSAAVPLSPVTVTVTVDCALGIVRDDARFDGPDAPLGDACLEDEDAVWHELRVRAAYYGGLGHPVEIRVTGASPVWLLAQATPLGIWR